MSQLKRIQLHSARNTSHHSLIMNKSRKGHSLVKQQLDEPLIKHWSY